MNFEKICQDIKKLKIQGAENVSNAAIQALELTAKKSRAKNTILFILELDRAKLKLFTLRPTEPQLRNYLDYILREVKNNADDKTITQLKKFTITLIQKILKDKKQSFKQLGINGAKLIKNNQVIFTHCHSTNVINILKTAKKKITVHNTETRPLFQGRKTAKDLSHLKIPVKHFVDSAARIAIKDSDIAIFGADAITDTKVFNKVGTEMLAIIAKTRRVPVYIATSLWSYDPDQKIVEERSPKEIWKNPPKGVEIQNFAFEKIPFKLIKGIITEKGILKPKKFVKLAKKLHIS